MSRISGRNGRLYVGLASDTADASPVAFLNQFSLSFATDREEVTAFGDSNKQYVQHLPDATGDYQGFYDTDTDQLYTAAIDGDARKFYLYPSTDDTAEYFYGTAFFDFGISQGVSAAITVNGSFQAASDVTKVSS